MGRETGDLEGAETELGGLEDLACPADGASPMPQTELSRNHEDVMPCLLVAQRLEHRHSALMLAEPVGTQLTLAVVGELAVSGLLDQIQNLFHGFTVGWGD